MNLYTELQDQLGYTEYQTKVVRYTIITITSELSKFILIGIPFILLGRFKYYLAAMVLLLFLRQLGGGLHCRTYPGCFVFSFIFMVLSILILPMLVVPRIVQCTLLLLALAGVIFIAPVPSIYHAPPQEITNYLP